MNKYKEALESMVWQFGYRGLRGKRQMIYSGGLSALEEAFDALGWDNPHYVKFNYMITCNIKGCHGWAVSGLCWGGMYLRLCDEHTNEQFKGKECPPIKESVVKRESKRDPVTGILPMEHTV